MVVTIGYDRIIDYRDRVPTYFAIAITAKPVVHRLLFVIINCLKFEQRSVIKFLITRKLATADWSRVSIRVVKNFVQDRGRGQACRNFPHMLFDHHAKSDCCFSFCVRAHRRSQKLVGLWDPLPWDGPWLTPKNMLLPTCYRTKFGRSRSNRAGVGRVPKLWKAGSLLP